jgi:acyl-CoA synthetase (AMP-forming)/AMP-acid ligase II
MQTGDRVCIAALGTDAHLEALLAVTAGGAIAAPLNWRWGAVEAAAAAQLVGARVLLADAACLRYALAAASAASGGTLRVLVLLGSPAGYPQQDLAAAEAQGVALAFAESLIDGCPNSCLALTSAPGNAALVVFTSGESSAVLLDCCSSLTSMTCCVVLCCAGTHS